MSSKYEINDDKLILTCDDCGFSEEFYGSFSDAIDASKQIGWLVQKHGGFWEHYCPDCKNK